MSGDTKSTTFNLRPGIYRNTTSIDAEGRWVDGDHVRWNYGNPEKIGGWATNPLQQQEDETSTTFTGVARDILIWQNNDGDADYIGVATHKKLELALNGVIYDITPIRTITSTSAIFNSSAGSDLITVSLAGHNGQLGSYVIFQSVASSVGGVTISGEYEIVSVIDANQFQIQVTTVAAATSAAAGGDVTVAFLLDNGLQSNGVLSGWGSGTWGRDGWGTSLSAASGISNKLRQWSLVNWGEDLLACPRGGRIYWWDQDLGTDSTMVNRADDRAVVVTASPTINNLILVSQPTRHLISFGNTDLTGDFSPLNVRWCSQENFDVWDPTVSLVGGNTAGAFLLRGGNQVVGVTQSKMEILIGTDDPVFAMRWVGGNTVFSFEEIGQNCGFISQHAAAGDISGATYWLGQNAFFKYNGNLQVLPCDLADALFRADNPYSINYDQREKIFAGVNTQFNEIIWLYPSRDEIENDRYVIYNYLENLWYDGTIDRTVWTDAGVFSKPYAINEAGTLFTHETGNDDGPQPLFSYLESSEFDLGDGDRVMFSDKYVPDFKRIPDGKTINFYITTKRYPQDQNPVIKGPYEITNTTQKVSYRARGRDAKIRIESSADGVDWQLGRLNLYVKEDGKR